METSMVWQIPVSILTGIGAFYFGSALSERKNKYNLCCFSAALLLFQSLIVFLPEIHLRAVELFKHGKERDFVEQEDDIFPLTFLVAALVFSMCLLMDKVIFRIDISKGNLQKHQERTLVNMRYLIPAGASFLLFNNFFYSSKDSNVFPEFSLSLLNSIFINASQGTDTDIQDIFTAGQDLRVQLRDMSGS